ncbi:MAG: formate--tetrahydrofolate ligase [Spirochaetes bacterium]|nr:formate--tetrahydrofolate ligase [Spirochaetota bacterium]
MKDIDISRKAKLLNIFEIAKKANIPEDFIEPYGKYKAKVNLDFYNSILNKPNGNLILVSAITPTPLGEGKTTISIAINDALNALGKKSFLALREPSLGPVFGVKGGATGGGYSQVVPIEDINLHFTGDFNAIEKAHNLIAAAVDVELFYREIGLDSRTVKFRRVIDLNDRSLRDIVIGLGGTKNGFPRETGFDITASSEVMAILCLASNYKNLKEMLGNIFIGFTYDDKPVYARDLKVDGAAAALLKDALKPNLVQSLENNPVFIHGGPFANIAQGTNSIIATNMAMKLGDFAVTEAGFGFDLGAEKFFDIVARKTCINISCVVIVATIRALKFHGGKKLKEIYNEDLISLEKGFENLEHHVNNIRLFGKEPIVAINKFSSDTDNEIKLLTKMLEDRKIKYSLVTAWENGSKGAIDLGEKIISSIKENESCHNKFLYELTDSVEEKIFKVASKLYGAKAIDFTPKAKEDLKTIIKLGLDKLPVCIAKTQKSLSDNPDLIGRPKDFLITVREIEIASGAGFIIPITGDILRMPGYNYNAAYRNITIDDNGNIDGLF